MYKVQNTVHIKINIKGHLSKWTYNKTYNKKIYIKTAYINTISHLPAKSWKFDNRFWGQCSKETHTVTYSSCEWSMAQFLTGGICQYL